MKIEIQIEQEGWEEYTAGVTLGSNPHPSGSDNYMHWKLGWLKASNYKVSPYEEYINILENRIENLEQCIAGYMSVAFIYGDQHISDKQKTWMLEQLDGKERSPFQVWNELFPEENIKE